jgi:hypothetical protein
MTFYDENRILRATVELAQGKPALKLMGDKGSASIDFDEEGIPTVTLKGDADAIIWKAP